MYLENVNYAYLVTIIWILKACLFAIDLGIPSGLPPSDPSSLSFSPFYLLSHLFIFFFKSWISFLTIISKKPYMFCFFSWRTAWLMLAAEFPFLLTLLRICWHRRFLLASYSLGSVFTLLITVVPDMIQEEGVFLSLSSSPSPCLFVFCSFVLKRKNVEEKFAIPPFI